MKTNYKFNQPINNLFFKCVALFNIVLILLLIAHFLYLLFNFIKN